MANQKLTYRELLLIIGFYFASIFVAAISMYSHASSMRLGLVVSIGIFLTLALIHGLRLAIPARVIVHIAGIFLVIALLYILSGMIFDGRDLNRFIGSLLLLIILFLTSFVFLRSISNIREEFFNSAVFFGFYLLAIVGYLAVFLQKSGYVEGKSMLIFSEPSHYGIAFLPFLLYVVLTSEKQVLRAIYMVLGFGLGILVQNLTIIAGAFAIIILIFFKTKKYFYYLIVISVLVFLLFLLDLSYFTERLNFSDDNSNLSTLVYLSGWERAYTGLQESYGIGLGLQQLGVVGEAGDYQVLLMSLLEGDNLNLFDGGSLASKIIAEFGLAGILSLLVYVYAALNVAVKVVSGKIQGSRNIFFSSVFLMFIIELFVRGMGYFSVTSFMFISSVYWLYSPRNYFNLTEARGKRGDCYIQQQISGIK